MSKRESSEDATLDREVKKMKTKEGFLPSLFGLRGRVAIVTGGTGVLGSAFCIGLARAGAKVGVLGRTKSKAEKVVREIKDFGGEAMELVADVTEESSLIKARDEVMRQWGRVDILVNGAGGNQKRATVGPKETFFGMSVEACERVFKLNIIGTVLPSQIFGKIIAEQESGGSIVNISSLSAKEPLTRVCGYSAAKAAVENFTKWLSVEFAQKHSSRVRVNAIAPGFFLAEQNRALLMKDDGKTLTDRGQTIIRNTPAGRFGNADELVGALVYLCSPSASFVTGTVLRVDGGFGAFSGV